VILLTVGVSLHIIQPPREERESWKRLAA